MNKLSVVIPCYNEEEALPRSLPLVFAALKKLPCPAQLIIVDDGSQDATSRVAREVLEDCPVPHVLFGQKKNQGKGAAVKKGIELATGDYVLFFDADLSTDLAAMDELARLLEKEDLPIIIGSRVLPGSRVTKTQNFARRGAGNLYRKFGIWFLGLRVTDIGCGFKCFKKDVADQLFSQISMNRWSFDAQVLLLAQERGIPIREIPVEWKNNPDSRLSLLRHGPAVIWKLLSLRIRPVWKKKSEQ